MSAVLAGVLFAGYAFYAIIRGREPGLYRGTWLVLSLFYLIVLSDCSPGKITETMSGTTREYFTRSFIGVGLPGNGIAPTRSSA